MAVTNHKHKREPLPQCGLHTAACWDRSSFTLSSDEHTTTLFSMPEKRFSTSHYDVRLITFQHAFLATVTHNPLHSGRDVTVREHRHVTALWQMKVLLNTSISFFVLQNVVLRLQKILKVQVGCLDEGVCPRCMHTACDSMNFLRAAAVCTKCRKKVSMRSRMFS